MNAQTIERQHSQASAPSFIIRKVRTPEEEAQVHRLRYRVYCEERGFEAAEDHAGGMEKDKYDAQSIHFLAMDPEQRPVGTIRLVLPTLLGFPMEDHCPLRAPGIARDEIAEISRLAISKLYRRRAGDSQHGIVAEEEMREHDERRRYVGIAFGLFKAMWLESRRFGLGYWCCAMERSLFVLLKRRGMAFTRIGEEVDYHGKRAPYLARIAEIEAGVWENNPEFYSFAVADGKDIRCGKV